MTNHRRLVAAPISWGICEVPGWGRMLDAERVLGEMASLGITATELGAPGFLPDDAAALRDDAGAPRARARGQLLARRRPRAVRRRRLRARDRAQARRARRRRDQPRARAGPGLERSTRAHRARSGRRSPRPSPSCEAAAAEEGVTLATASPRGDARLHGRAGRRARWPRRRAAGAWTPGTCTSAGSIPPRSPPSTRERVVHVHLKDVDARRRRAPGRAVAARSRAGGAVRPAGRRRRGRRPRHRRARPRGLLALVGARAGHRDHRAGARGGQRADASPSSAASTFIETLALTEERVA